MSGLSLGLTADKIFGSYLPSVYIRSVIINNPLDAITGTPDIAGTTLINCEFEISFDKPAEADIDIEDWVTEQLDHLQLYVFLSPFGDLNTNLEESNLSMKDLMGAMYPAKSSDFKKSWPGFLYIMSRLKESFIADWYGSSYCAGTHADGTAWTADDRRAGLGDMTSEIAERFYGRFLSATSWAEGDPTNTEGPWDGTIAPCFITENIDETLAFINPTLSDDDYGSKFTTATLSSLASGTGEIPGSTIETEGHYDSEGNEIIKISNINIQLEYKTDTYPTNITPRLQNTEKLFLIATIGHDMTSATLTGFSESLYNSNFGDISYEHILQNNQVPDQTEVIFREITTKEVFNGKPIQTLDRKYFVPTPLDQSIITESVENLMTNFNKWTQNDKRLERNVNNLKALMAAKSTSTDLLLELKKYLNTYPQKDFGSPPGKFFKALSDVVASFNEGVSKQLQLARNLTFNAKVIDNRPPPLKNTYQPPGDRGFTRLESADFIPPAWSMMSRYIEQTLPVKGLMTDFAEFALAEGFLDDYLVVDDSGRMVDVEEDELMKNVFEAWEYFDSAAGYTAPTTGVEQYADTVVANKGIWHFDYEKALHSETVISKVFNVRKIQDLFHYTVPYEYYFCSLVSQYRREADLVLNNAAPTEGDGYSGHVPDDYHTICLWTRMWEKDTDPPKVPYSLYFNYTYDTSNLKYGQPYVYTFGKAGVEPWAVPTTLEDYSGDTYEAPELSVPEFELGADPASMWGDAAVKDEVWDMYSLPSDRSAWSVIKDYVTWIDESADWASTTQFRTHSYIRYACFDVANPTYSERLEGFGNYDMPDYRTMVPFGPRDGYRILSFQYRDFMDDDVAYYNTWGSFYGGRNGEYIAMMEMGEDYVEGVSDVTRDSYVMLSSGEGDLEMEKRLLDDVWTTYDYEVYMRDRTIEVYDDIYDMAMEAFEALEKYHSLAQELCNFNNITGAFNQFFSEGVYNYYGGELKPWITAAYMYNALRELIYAAFSENADTPTNMEKLLEDTRRIADRIGPINGSVANIASFVGKFRLVLNSFYNQEGMTGGEELAFRAWNVSALSDTATADYDDDAATMIAELKTTYNDYSDKFTNYVKIDKMIYGNLALSAYWEDQFVDYIPPSCKDMHTDPDLTDEEKVYTWLACASTIYKGSLKDYCETRAGGFYTYGPISESNTIFKIYRRSMMTAAFLYEFQDMIDDYRYLSHTSYIEGGAGDPFYNRDEFKDFFRGEPWNLDDLSPMADGEPTWLTIIDQGIHWLNKMNQTGRGTLEDTWIPTSAWNQGPTTYYGVADWTDTPWMATYVKTDYDWIYGYTDDTTYEGTTVVAGGEVEPTTWEDIGRLPVFYWLEYEMSFGYYGSGGTGGAGAGATRLWTTAADDFYSTYSSWDVGPWEDLYDNGQQAWQMTTTMGPDSHGVYSMRQWRDQFQFDLGLVQMDSANNQFLLDGTPIS